MLKHMLLPIIVLVLTTISSSSHSSLFVVAFHTLSVNRHSHIHSHIYSHNDNKNINIFSSSKSVQQTDSFPLNCAPRNKNHDSQHYSLPLLPIPTTTTTGTGTTRRQLLVGGNNFLSASFVSALVASASCRNAMAAVTDETNNFAVKDSAYVMDITDDNAVFKVKSTGTGTDEEGNDGLPKNRSPSSSRNSESQLSVPTDEITIEIPLSKLQSSSLGVELADVEFRTNRRVYVKSVLPSSVGAQYNIQPNYILVRINGQSTERTNARGVVQMISQVKQSSSYAAADNLVLVFRDDSFQKQLNDLSNVKEVTTQVSPAGDTTQRNPDGSVKFGYQETTQQQDQRITVTQLIPPKMCKRGADIDDLLEISYVGTILETGAVFDGSAIKIDGNGIPGRGNDVSIFFVLGKQPFGQFPPGWDVGLRGICVGERRRLIVPPVLAYGSTGVPRRNIPPNATLVYDVTLVSLNGLATPQ